MPPPALPRVPETLPEIRPANPHPLRAIRASMVDFRSAKDRGRVTSTECSARHRRQTRRSFAERKSTNVERPVVQRFRCVGSPLLGGNFRESFRNRGWSLFQHRSRVHGERNSRSYLYNKLNTPPSPSIPLSLLSESMVLYLQGHGCAGEAWIRSPPGSGNSHGNSRCGGEPHEASDHALTKASERATRAQVATRG